ncbi:hypothetical protein, partial [Sphingobium sp. D43FB]|uniref:hypothetical protein n=1 Tax=Sphingobium sp. D43FB TaxID=2017595 RepID=UPI000BDD5658
NKQEQIRIAVSQSFYESLQNPDTDRILTEALHRGSKFYFTNYVKIKELKNTDNMLAYLLNNNIQYTATGKNSFIDDSAVSSRMDSSDLLDLGDAYSEIIAIYDAKPKSTTDVDFSEMTKDYLFNTSKTNSSSSVGDTISSVVSGIAKDYQKLYKLDGKCEDDCIDNMQDSAVTTTQLGAKLINAGAMIKGAQYALAFIDVTSDSKAA